MIIWFLAVICPLYSTSSSTDFYSMGGPHKSSPEIATMATWGDRLATRGALEAGRNWQSGFVWSTRTCSWQSVTFCDILRYSVIFWGWIVNFNHFKKWCGAAVVCPWEVSASAKEGLADFFSDWFGSLRLHHKERLRNSVKSFEGSTLWSHLARLQARKHV